MADNTTLNVGTGGDVIATDDIGGVKYQRVKIVLGANNTNDGDVASGNPIPITGVLTGAIPAGTNNIGDVDVLTVPAPLNLVGGGVEAAALRVTIATDSTGVLSVDDNGGSLTVDGTVAVSSLPALPAGTNNIGDVDVLTVPAPLSTTGGGTEATALRVTIANNSTGVLAVTDNSGSLTVDGTVTANQGTAGTAWEVIGDVAHDAAGSAINPLAIGGYANAAAPTDVSADVDVVRAWFLRNGAQATVITAAGALIGGDAANGLDVDVTRLPALPAGSNNIGDVDVLTVPAPLSTTGGGTEATALRVTIANNSTGVLAVTDNAGSLTVDGTITANQGTAGTAWEVIGDVAHDAAGAAINPLSIGGYASAAAPTDVSADNDVVRAWFLRNGAQATVITAAGALVGGDAANGLDVDVTRLPALPAGTNNIGDVDVLTVPADPFGVNADAASATGSISAKLRYLAATGLAGMTSLPAGTNNIGDVDVLTVPAPLSTTGGGTEAAALRVTIANNSTGVIAVTDNSGSLTVDGTVTVNQGTAGAAWEVVGDVAHDAPGASINPVAVGGFASAAAPSDVSADVDVVRAWYLRNGAQATVLTAAGALIGGDASNGLDVDVTRVSGNVSVIGINTDNTANTTTKVATLPARANDAEQTWTEGNQVPLSTDLSGRLRTKDVTGSFELPVMRRLLEQMLEVLSAQAAIGGLPTDPAPLSIEMAPAIHGIRPEIQYTTISASASGNNTILAAQGNQRIIVMAYTLVASGAVNVRWYSDATAISGLMNLAANGGMAPSSQLGLFSTLPGSPLVLNLSGATAVGGHLSYLVV